MKDLRAKNINLAQKLEIALHNGDEVSTARVKAEKSKLKSGKVDSKFEKAKVVAQQLKKELYEI